MTPPRTITRAVQAVFAMRDALRKKPISAQDLADELGMSDRATRLWLKSLQQLRKVRPHGVKPLEPGQRGTGAMLWTWVDE